MKVNALIKKILTSAILLASAVAIAATISEDFEGSTLGSPTPPTGWSFIIVDNDPQTEYVTTNGLSGAGLGGQVTANHDLNGSGIPGAYAVINSAAGGAPFDLTQPINGSFDFQIPDAGNYSSAIFFFGDIEDGITETDPGEWLGMVLKKNTFAARSQMVQGNGGGLTNTTGTTAANTWYAANFTWTPTSGTTGNFSFSISGAHSWTLAYNGFTFNNERAFFGFGSGGYFAVDMMGVFDNFIIDGKPINPAGTIIIIK